MVCCASRCCRCDRVVRLCRGCSGCVRSRPVHVNRMHARHRLLTCWRKQQPHLPTRPSTQSGSLAHVKGGRCFSTAVVAGSPSKPLRLSSSAPFYRHTHACAECCPSPAGRSRWQACIRTPGRCDVVCLSARVRPTLSSFMLCRLLARDSFRHSGWMQ